VIACAAPAPALATSLAAPATTDRVCHARALGASAAVRTQDVTARGTGVVRSVLRAAGDWDVGVFDARTGRFVAGAAGPGGDEVAEGYARAGQRLRVLACRRPGAATRADVRTSTIAMPAESGSARPVQVVRVSVPTPAAQDRLARLRLDPAEAGRPGAVDVVLHDARDSARLRASGLRFEVRTRDLGAAERRNARADRRYAQATTRSSLPSTRDGYRHLADYEAELKRLALAHPGLVKLIVLPHRSLQGRQVLGVEIARDVNVPRGQPVNLQLGVHHAREWPAGELPMEWARDLVKGYGVDPRITRLVDATRTIVVPIVNPDGFTLSREWPTDLGIELDVAGLGYRYKRRNCRIVDGAIPAPGQCESLANRRRGVDPNRNYGGYWGGPGASVSRSDDTYRGPGPFSEPEVQNVRELVSSNQVTTLLTHHTYGNLVLRPPGIRSAPEPPDERLLALLGDAMAAHNGYASGPGYGLYDAAGTTEDWSYGATGALSFTFEHGASQFHPPFAEVVGQYARNREAFFESLESTASRTHHAVARGQARPGTVLRVRKEFDATTAPVLLSDFSGVTSPARTFHDVLTSTMTVGDTGRFAWHLNPSTRPAASGPESWKVTCERPQGSVRARTKLRVARGEETALNACGLNLSVAVTRRALGRALRRGLRARVRCAMACKATLTLTLASATARRYGLTKRRTGRIVVARGARRRSFTGRKTIKVRFTRSARRKLVDARRLRPRLSTLARGGGPTERQRVNRTITLRR